MNGIREQDWLRLTSVHMNLKTLRFVSTRITIDGTDTNINMFEIKVTSSMKIWSTTCMLYLLWRMFVFPDFPSATAQMVGCFIAIHWLSFC